MSAPVDRCVEFDCCECRRHIIWFAGVLPDPRICATCTFIPGWFTHAELRQILDPEHDGQDPAEPVRDHA